MYWRYDLCKDTKKAAKNKAAGGRLDCCVALVMLLLGFWVVAQEGVFEIGALG